MFFILGMVLQVIIEPFNLFSATGWGIDFDYCDIEWFAFEMQKAWPRGATPCPRAG